MNTQDTTAGAEPTAEELEAQLHRIDEERAELKIRARELIGRIVAMRAEFKVGTLITHDGAKHVWQVSKHIAHMGYTFGSEPRRVGVNYMGRALKKDGTPGAAERELYAFLRESPLRLARPDEIPGGAK